MSSIKPSFILSEFVLCRTFCAILSRSSAAAAKDSEVNSTGKTLPRNGNSCHASFTSYWQVYNARFITGTGRVNKRCFAISLNYSPRSMWPWLLPLSKQRLALRYKTTKGEEKTKKPPAAFVIHVKPMHFIQNGPEFYCTECTETMLFSQTTN